MRAAFSSKTFRGSHPVRGPFMTAVLIPRSITFARLAEFVLRMGILYYFCFLIDREPFSHVEQKLQRASRGRGRSSVITSLCEAKTTAHGHLAFQERRNDASRWPRPPSVSTKATILFILWTATLRAVGRKRYGRLNTLDSSCGA